MAGQTLITTPRQARIAAALEALYSQYNDRGYVDPDPLAPVLAFDDPRDQEIAGLIAASLAFGNVKTILGSIGQVFRHLPEPREALLYYPPEHWEEALQDFRHRYVTGIEMAALLRGIRQVLLDHGSLEACFLAGLHPCDATCLPALGQFVDALAEGQLNRKNYLLPHPASGSACKRHFMYLRWMVRRDDVDLGLWPEVPARTLLYPMDTHLYRMARHLRFTRRKTADLKTTLEVTQRFARYSPEDPVRYDFCLTRLGIRSDATEADFLAAIKG